METEKDRYSRLQKLINLFRITKYGLVIGALLVGLPLTAYPWMPWHVDLVFGNLFHELRPVDLFFLTGAMTGASWSLVFTQGLIIHGMAIRYWGEDNPKSVEEGIPVWARRLLTIPMTGGQVWLVLFFSAFGLFVVNRFADGVWPWRLTSTLLGVIVSTGVVLVPVILIRLAVPDYTPLEFLSEKNRQLVWSFLQGIGRMPFVRPTKDGARWCTTKALEGFRWMLPHLGMRYLSPDYYYPHHFLGFCAVMTLAGILLIVGVFFAPGGTYEMAPVFYLYVLLILCIWAFSAMDFHLSRRGFSPLLFLVVLALIGDWVHGRDHYYDIKQATTTPSAPVAFRGEGENLVVVAATGGGIAAAGWTTWALKEFLLARPDLKHELGLVSGVSGGAVGTAFFVDGISECGWKTPSGAGSLVSEDRLCLTRIYRRSVASSLGATAYGFAYPDFWRAVTFSYFPWNDVDRGTYLEDRWRRIAASQLLEGDENGRTGHLVVTQESRTRAISSLAPEVASGAIPAFILSTTAMETGRRVMISPVAFESPCLYNHPRADRGHFRSGTETAQHGKQRACTLEEYLGDGAIDIDLWTAARLSATFPWISPAARARKMEDLGGNRPSHHMVDGGYYDNYGVPSALDWLQSLFATETRIRRLAFVELRAFSTKGPEKTKPRPGSFAAMFGPLIGLLATYDASALERDRIEVDRYLSQLANAHQGQLDIRRFVFELPGEHPTSWHLTTTQEESIREQWETEAIQNRLKELKDFLK